MTNLRTMQNVSIEYKLLQNSKGLQKDILNFKIMVEDKKWA